MKLFIQESEEEKLQSSYIYWSKAFIKVEKNTDADYNDIKKLESIA